jgi:hypothetical protein
LDSWLPHCAAIPRSDFFSADREIEGYVLYVADKSTHQDQYLSSFHAKISRRRALASGRHITLRNLSQNHDVQREATDSFPLYKTQENA